MTKLTSLLLSMLFLTWIPIFSNNTNGIFPNEKSERSSFALMSTDLELEMTTTNASPDIYSTTSLTVTLTNTGADAATGVVVLFPKPSGTVYEGGNEWTASQGVFNPFGAETWEVGGLSPGESATLTVSYFMLSALPQAAFAQVSACNETDVDSTPNNANCCTPNEDDEAVVNLNGNPTAPCSGDIELTSQADIDNWPGCTVVNGNLIITSGPDITDLSPLATLEEVTGDLLITSNNGLQSLNGLDNLTTVGGNFLIKYFDNLTNISALSNLTTVGGRFDLTTLYVLPNINGLSSLTSVGELYLFNLPQVSSLSPLNNLTEINGRLNLVDLPQVPNIDFLANASGQITDLRINSLPLITNVDALSWVTQISGNLQVFSNDALSSCCGLFPLLDNNGVGGTISISNNPQFCGSEAEILVNCGGTANCEINANTYTICDDNGTPSDPSDDLFFIDIDVSAIEGGISGWQTAIGGTTYSGPYNLLASLGSYPISGGSVTFEVQDVDDPTCSKQFTVNPPAPCSTGGDLPDFNLVSFFAVYPAFGGSVVQPGDEIVAGTDVNVPDHSATLDFPVTLPTFDLNISAFLSTDETVDGGDILITSTTRLMDATNQFFGFTEGSIGIGTIPAGTPPGNYFILLKIDGDDQILESDETNNTLSVAVVVTSGGPGDFIDLELSLNQPDPNPSQWSSYLVTATLENNGDTPATGVKVDFQKPTGVVYTGGNEYDASQGTFNPNGDQIWTVGTLAPGASATLDVNYFLLSSDAPVAYAQVSAANETDADSTPGNGTPPTPNEDDEASTDGGSPPIERDLSVSNVLPIPGTVMSGDNLTGQFDVFYTTTFGTANFKYAAYLSVDPVLSADDHLINNQFYQVNSFPSGVATPFQVNFTMPSGLPNGLIYFIAVVDPTDEIAETDETNNVGFNSFLLDNGTAGQPDLTISNFEIPAPIVEAGQILHYNFDLANEGGVNVPGDFFIRSYISTNSYISADDIQDGTILTGNFNAGFSVESVPGASTIPSDLPTGQYYLIVKIDADEQVAESIEYNNTVFAQFNVTNTSVPPGDCETEVGFGTFVCAEYHAPGELAIIHNDLGNRELTIVDMDAQVLSNQVTGATPPSVNEYISGNRLVRVVNGVETFSKDIPTALLDQYEIFSAWMEYNGGYLIFAFENGNPTSNLHVIETDIDLNVLSDNFLTGFSSNQYGASIRTPKLIAPNRIAFIFQPSYATFEDSRLVVMDDNFDIKTDNSLGSGFYTSAQLKEGACEEWELVVNIGISFCTHGACYINTTSFGSFVNDNFVAYSSMSASELSTYGQGTRMRTWSVSLPSGTAYNATLTQNLIYPLTTFNNDVVITKTTGGTFVWEKTVTVPDAISIVAIQEVGGELYFIRESMGVISMLSVDCLENTPPPGDGVDLELSMGTSNPNPAVYSNVEVDLTLTNAGTEAATGIVVEFKRPAGTVYTGGNEYDASQGVFNPFGPETWEVGTLAAGETATLTVSYFLLTGNALTPYAQVLAQNEPDADSSPGNGTCCTPNEDDEATLTLNAFAGGGGTSLARPDEVGRNVQLRSIDPNPVYFSETKVTLDSRVDGWFELETYDVFGRLAATQKVELREGRNEILMDVSEFRSGTYYLNMPGENWRYMPLRFVVARW